MNWITRLLSSCFRGSFSGTTDTLHERATRTGQGDQDSDSNRPVTSVQDGLDENQGCFGAFPSIFRRQKHSIQERTNPPMPGNDSGTDTHNEDTATQQISEKQTIDIAIAHNDISSNTTSCDANVSSRNTEVQSSDTELFGIQHNLPDAETEEQHGATGCQPAVTPSTGSVQGVDNHTIRSQPDSVMVSQEAISSAVNDHTGGLSAIQKGDVSVVQLILNGPGDDVLNHSGAPSDPQVSIRAAEEGTNDSGNAGEGPQPRKKRIPNESSMKGERQPRKRRDMQPGENGVSPSESSTNDEKHSPMPPPEDGVSPSELPTVPVGIPKEPRKRLVRETDNSFQSHNSMPKR